jgi:hypothetical protein
MATSLLKFPFPFKAWMTIANDPDNTCIDAWKQLNDLIFLEWNLPWANSVFVSSHNLNIPDQVNLTDYPEISSQPTDTLHTWGDFVHAGRRGFSREDAEEAIDILNKLHILPRVWVDHSRFSGNLINNSQLGQTPYHKDGSGTAYLNHEYTLDLIKKAGIAYVWNGHLTQTVGQGRPLHWRECARRFNKQNLRKYLRIMGKGEIFSNYLIQPLTFADGNKCYVFPRYGTWRNAHIEALPALINDTVFDELIRCEGAMVAYTHLGKSVGKKFELSEPVRDVFRKIRKNLDEKRINFSSVSALLDYTVLTRHIQIRENKIHFMPDEIRFPELTTSDLAPHSFSFKTGDADVLRCFIGEQPIPFEVIRETNQIVTIRFQ